MTQSDVTTIKNQLGTAFQQARLHRKLSVEDVSNAIHLSEKQIVALESNNFNALPEAVITRGFIRSYAKFLELDDAPLLNAYRNLVPNVEQKSIVVKANVNEVMSHKIQQPWLVYILGSILVLLFLTAWFYYMDSIEGSKETSHKAEIIENNNSESVVSTTAVGNVTETSTQNIPLTTNAPTEEAQVPFVSSDNTASVNPIDPNQTQQQTQPQNNKTPVAIQAPVTLTPVIAKKLELQFSADSWVRVKDKTGQVVLEKTAVAGSTESIDSDPPFNIIIGNATAAKVKYYGQEVDLTSYTSKNIIRLKLE